MTLPIDHNVPMPHIRGNEMRETINKMRKGDSFLVADEPSRQRALQTAIRMGAKVTSAKQNGTGFRVWLVNKNGKK